MFALFYILRAQNYGSSGHHRTGIFFHLEGARIHIAMSRHFDRKPTRRFGATNSSLNWRRNERLSCKRYALVERAVATQLPHKKKRGWGGGRKNIIEKQMKETREGSLDNEIFSALSDLKANSRFIRF